MFLNPRDFPFTTLLESQWKDIRREFEQLSPDQLMPWPETDLYNSGWEVFGLWAMGKKLIENCQACPLTTQIVEGTPGMTTAGFSLLASGARISPHVGYTNSVLRCHLGIVVPANCGIQVGDEIQHWQERRCLVFDDTITHSAWNESTESRIVLLVDLLRAGCEFDSTVSAEVEDLNRANVDGNSQRDPKNV